jgi:hypothetical protein
MATLVDPSIATRSCSLTMQVGEPYSSAMGVGSVGSYGGLQDGNEACLM